MRFLFNTIFFVITILVMQATSIQASTLGSVIDCKNFTNQVPSDYEDRLKDAIRLAESFTKKHREYFSIACLKKINFESADGVDESSSYEFNFARKNDREEKVIMELDIVAPRGSGHLFIGEFEKEALRSELSQFFPKDLAKEINRVFDKDCKKVSDIEISERDVGRSNLFSNPNRNTLFLEYTCHSPSGLAPESKISISVFYELMNRRK